MMANCRLASSGPSTVGHNWPVFHSSAGPALAVRDGAVMYASTGPAPGRRGMLTGTDLLLSALSRSDAAADNADAQHRFFWAHGDVNQSIMLF